MNNPFLNRLIKDKTKDVVHSSAYAKAQNSNGLGATSSQSFTDRMKIEHNRKRIRGYNDARVVAEAYKSSGIKAKTYTPSESEGTTPQSNSKAPNQTTSQNNSNPSNLASRSNLKYPSPASRSNFRSPGPTLQSSPQTPSSAPHPPARKNPGIMR